VSTDQIEIRPLVGADVSAVLSIWNRALPRDPTSEARFVRTVLSDPDYWPGDDSGFLVAVRAGRVVGFVRAVIRRWPNDRLGLEPQNGWISILAVDAPDRRSGAGTALLEAALSYFRRLGRKRVWVCGTTTSAPGSIVPGVDRDAYPGALKLFEKLWFIVDQEAFSMARDVVDFDVETFRRDAWASGLDIEVSTLSWDQVPQFLRFLSESLPGAWTIAGRAKVRSGELGEILIARQDGAIVGYCQWQGEHFGPFGVAPAARNRKVGAKLFAEAVQRIREAGGRSVWFNWADASAARFYERFGLRVTRRYAVLRRVL
jgi:mycothiol synthase